MYSMKSSYYDINQTFSTNLQYTLFLYYCKCLELKTLCHILILDQLQCTLQMTSTQFVSRLGSFHKCYCVQATISSKNFNNFVLLKSPTHYSCQRKQIRNLILKARSHQFFFYKMCLLDKERPYAMILPDTSSIVTTVFNFKYKFNI